MQVVLIGKNKLCKINLPKKIGNNYWITDKTQGYERKIINIVAYNGDWEILSNSYAKILNPKNINITNNKITVNEIQSSIIEKTLLKENNMYAIKLQSSEDICILYCASENEDEFLHLNMQDTQEITIGSSENNTIIYKNMFISSTHVRIFKNNAQWYLQNYDHRYGTFVNNIPVYDNIIKLSNGDNIYLMGLKIIIMKDSIYINNPQNNMIYSDRYFILDESEKVNFDINKNEEEDSIKARINREEQYYSKAPRIMNLIETEIVKIDEPPQLQDDRDKPMFLVLGASLAMGLMMLFSISSTTQKSADGKIDVGEVLMSVFMVVLVIIAMLLIPILDVKYDKKSKIKYEQKRQRKYKEYLGKKRTQINNIKNKQRRILYKNFLSNQECLKVIFENNPRLWERRKEDKDFLSVRLGIGKVPLNIDISYPEEKFEMEEDDLLDVLNNIVDESKYIDGAPITISFTENNISAMVFRDYNYMHRFMQNIILQLVTFQSYADLKLVFLLNRNTSKYWEYVKMLPHIWNNEKTIRFFADDDDDMNEISQYLITELKSRVSTDENKNYKSFEPYYLIITDDYKKIENLNCILEILSLKTNIGFSLLCITNNLIQLPNKCKTFISVESEVNAIIFENEITDANQKNIKLDKFDSIDFTDIVRRLSNIYIRTTAKTKTSTLPKGYSFLEMFNVGKIERLNVLERWKRNRATLSLKAPIGIDTEENIIYLDAHERFHGPHGLIAGSTGSGKSEFIITYILSLAINYHPDDVTFLLIDYKGGGLAGAFKKASIKLPHLVGTITNIDTNGLQRSLISIQSELRRRQKVFNEARNISNEGTMDIYKYQSLYHEGVVKEPISHLFIICDEFAELKQQQESFMDELISVSRIGRSLGVHLILATQKPAGIVNDQIRSNSKFAICLKVQDVSDSTDVIGKKDAAYLKEAGQFFLRVGQDEYFVLGKSGWAGEQYIPSDITQKTEDTAIEFISNIGLSMKRVDNVKNKTLKSHGEQLTNIVSYICDLAEQENIKTHNLWLEDIPKYIYIQDVRMKYNIKHKNGEVEAIIGEYDDPFNQKQGAVPIKLSNKENVIVLGNAESGKETLLSTFIYDVITNYMSTQVQFYILDFGSEALKIFSKAPHVGDIVFISEDEKIHRFFEMILKEVKKRKSILSDYNGDYDLYISKGNEMPLTVVVINNYEAFAEIYEDIYDDAMLSLTREGSKYGIIFIVSTATMSGMRYRLAQNFGRRIALQLNDPDEYYSIFDKIGKKRPARIFGRGLVIVGHDDNIFEFQTAKICDDRDYQLHIEETIKKLNKTNNVKAQPIQTIPKTLKLQSVQEYLQDVSKVPIGMIKKNLNIFTYDFTENFLNIISSKNLIDAITFSSYIIEAMKKLKNINIKILNLEDSKDVEGDCKKFISELKKDIKKKDEKFNLCVIRDIDKLLHEDIIDEFEFGELLGKAKDSKKFSFLIIDTPAHIQDHVYEDWYLSYAKENTGIWVGNGIEEQMLLTLNYGAEDVNSNCGRSFGYVVQEGEAMLIKLIGMTEVGDEDE